MMYEIKVTDLRTQSIVNKKNARNLDHAIEIVSKLSTNFDVNYHTEITQMEGKE